MKKLFIIILLSLSYISYGQRHYVSYKNIMYSYNEITDHWDYVLETNDDIKLTVFQNDIFVESKDMSHYTKYLYYGMSQENGYTLKKWKAYDNHNRTLIVFEYSYSDETRISFMYNDVAYTYCILK